MKNDKHAVSVLLNDLQTYLDQQGFRARCKNWVHYTKGRETDLCLEIRVDGLKDRGWDSVSCNISVNLSVGKAYITMTHEQIEFGLNNPDWMSEICDFLAEEYDDPRRKHPA